MVIRGTARVTCPACKQTSEHPLVQSINTRTNPADKQRLLDGELNVFDCACGKRVQLAANLLFHDPDADYFCHVVPGGEKAITEAEAAFAVAGATGTQRIVPSQNALVEKVKLLDVGLEDWAIEMTKVLLLASIVSPHRPSAALRGPAKPVLAIGEIDRVLLFDELDRDAQLIRWLIFSDDGRDAEPVSSPLAAYERIASRTHGKPPRNQLRVDRAWAIAAVQAMIGDAN